PGRSQLACCSWSRLPQAPSRRIRNGNSSIACCAPIPPRKNPPKTKSSQPPPRPLKSAARSARSHWKTERAQKIFPAPAIFPPGNWPSLRSRAGPASGASKAAPGSRLAFATQPAGNLRSAPDSDKKRPSRAYAQSRPFLGEGKSQKSLNRQNAPLTIEQVRELLNKNK